jgi:fructose-specific phosphotransferase system component IIB
MRKTTLTNDFGMAMEASPHGIAKEYLFRDSQVYKAAAEQLDYRLEVVYSNGARETLTTQSINYTSTAIRRTWGSLKALFQ